MSLKLILDNDMKKDVMVDRKAGKELTIQGCSFNETNKQTLRTEKLS